MSNNNKISTLWFSNMKGSIGIVLQENDKGEPVAYISQVDGHNLEKDVAYIKAYGAKIRKDQASRILNHLNDESK